MLELSAVLIFLPLFLFFCGDKGGKPKKKEEQAAPASTITNTKLASVEPIKQSAEKMEKSKKPEDKRSAEKSSDNKPSKKEEVKDEKKDEKKEAAKKGSKGSEAKDKSTTNTQKKKDDEGDGGYEQCPDMSTGDLAKLV